MEYNADEHELKIIEKPQIDGSGDTWYISNKDSENRYLLTDGTVPHYSGSKHIKLVYHSSEEVAWEFYRDWKKSKEIDAGKKEKKSPLKPIKRMNKADFIEALDGI